VLTFGGVIGPGGLMIRYANVPYVYIASGLLLMLASTLGETWSASALCSMAVAHAAGRIRVRVTRPDADGDAAGPGVARRAGGDAGDLWETNTARQQVIWD